MGLPVIDLTFRTDKSFTSHDQDPGILLTYWRLGQLDPIEPSMASSRPRKN